MEDHKEWEIEEFDVSVPIWGLFNLTILISTSNDKPSYLLVSVPIWGLFNLTVLKVTLYTT